MDIEVKLPQWGMAMREGTILQWLVAVGDTVAEDDPLADIEAEKTESQVFAPESGVLTEIRCQKGETVAVGSVLAIIREDS